MKRQSLEARIAAALPHDPPARAAEVAKAVSDWQAQDKQLQAVWALLAAGDNPIVDEVQVFIDGLRHALTNTDDQLRLMVTGEAEDAAADLRIHKARIVVRTAAAAFDRWVSRDTHVSQKKGRRMKESTRLALALESMLRKQLGLSARKCADVLAALDLNAATAEKYRRRSNRKKNPRRTK